MQFSDYLASGGLERLLIIVGALLIGYWGYRIHARARNAGLALLGLAGTVLLAALFTATRPVYRAAEFAGRPSAAPAPLATTPQHEQAPRPEPVRTGRAAPAEVAARAPEPAAASPSTSAPGQSAPPASATVEDHGTTLASGDELGGRIVSVRGGNISLEWTSPPAEKSSPHAEESSPHADQASPEAAPRAEVSPPPSP